MLYNFPTLGHAAMQPRNLNDLPFLKSLCWQGEVSSIEGLSDPDIIQLYERNWHYRGVLADLNEIERNYVHQLALKHHSWLVNEL
jgi:hypothetical protein